jgi:NADH-quinone oxidoreductase subunit G
LKKNSFDVVLSFSSEHIADAAFKESFKVYFGHHGDEGAMNADIVLPTPLYTEKNGIFMNIEGRPQEAKKCHNPIGEAKEEWKILKELSNQLSLNFEINTFDELRAELSNNYPNLVNLNEIISSDEKYEDQSSITFESNSCIYPIHNFYMSDIISKNSKTMAKCVEDILSKPLLEKSA